MRPLGKRCLLYLWNFFFFSFFLYALFICVAHYPSSFLTLTVSNFFSGSPYVHRHFVVVVVIVVAVVGLLVSKLGCTALPS
jgi:hypothetical protein